MILYTTANCYPVFFHAGRDHSPHQKLKMQILAFLPSLTEVAIYPVVTIEYTEEFVGGISVKYLSLCLDCKEIQPVHPKGDQSWGFIGRTDVEAETPILWPPHAKS